MSDEFINLYKEVMGRTLLTPDRLWYLWLLPRLQADDNVEGAFAELGVYKGGSAKMIYESVHGGVDLCLFDTFRGVPQSKIRDTDYCIKNSVYEEEAHRGMMQAGSFSCSVDEVSNLFAGKENVWIMPGIFPDETGAALGDNVFSFVHIDMDLYEPTLEALRLFYDRMPPGGIFICDDYGHLNGVTQAVNLFAEEKGLKVVQSTFMQGVIRKPLEKERLKWDPSNILWQFGG